MRSRPPIQLSRRSLRELQRAALRPRPAAPMTPRCAAVLDGILLHGLGSVSEPVTRGRRP